jgi:hypothetical protein
MKGVSMAKKKVKVWSKAEISQLKKMFPVMSTRKVAAKLKRSEKAVMQKAFKMQIRKSKKYLKSIGKA